MSELPNCLNAVYWTGRKMQEAEEERKAGLYSTETPGHALQQRILNHMLPTHQKLGLTISQHKAICAAIVELMGVELMVLVDDVFQRIQNEQA